MISNCYTMIRMQPHVPTVALETRHLLFDHSNLKFCLDNHTPKIAYLRVHLRVQIIF